MTTEYTPDTSWLAGTWNEEGEQVSDVNAHYSINTKLPYVAIGDWYWQGEEADNVINEVHQIWLKDDCSNIEALKKWENLML